MATAIHVITESRDHYNWATEEDLTSEQLTKFLKERLGEEFDYIGEVWATLSTGVDVED